MIEEFSDRCLLEQLYLEYLLLEPLDYAEDGKRIYNVISSKEVTKNE